jgi:hypothetical protein
MLDAGLPDSNADVRSPHVTDILRKLFPACVFVAAVLLVTLAVLTFSPAFVAVPLAVFCAIVGRALLAPDPGPAPSPISVASDDVTLVPRLGDRTR